MEDSSYFSWFDRFIGRLHDLVFIRHRLASVLLSVLMYVLILVFLGPLLEISSNYFVILPVLAISVGYGFLGGLLSGMVALPCNLLLFALIGHPDFSPESKLIAEFSGIVVGTMIGYLSDYYRKCDLEIRRRRETQERLTLALGEKDLLLREVHHRVKNNLSVIKSLISLQAVRSPSEDFRRESRLLMDRIFSISLVQELLYRNRDLGGVDIRDYLETLARNIISGYASREIDFDFRVDMGEVCLPLDTATNLGLIVNEVITNSMKYAFEGVDKPRLSLDLHAEGSHYRLILRDNGRGFDPSAVVSRGLGIQLIETLCGQLHAEFSFSLDGGTRFELLLGASAPGNSRELSGV